MRGSHPERSLERLVAEAVRPRTGEVLVAAVSGGPDSVALAALLAHGAAPAGAHVVVAHVNHGARPGSDQDEAVVLALGSTLGLRVVTRRLEPGPAGEARLRRGRYAALGEIARNVGARRIFTAHQAEDQTETVLLALFRGTGPAGLAGMPPVRRLGAGLSLERPLLAATKAQLTAYALARRLPFALDPTNESPGYRRNAVRRALGDLRGSFPGLDAAVARWAAIARQERAGAEPALIRRDLRAELAAALGDARDLTFERLDAAARSVAERRPGRHFLRPGVELVVRPRRQGPRA